MEVKWLSIPNIYKHCHLLGVSNISGLYGTVYQPIYKLKGKTLCGIPLLYITVTKNWLEAATNDLWHSRNLRPKCPKCVKKDSASYLIYSLVEE